MQVNLLHLKTSDDYMLPGLFHEVEGSKKVAIYLHGNGSSSVFYHDDERHEFADALKQISVSFFEFNNRGANYIKKLYSNKTNEGKRYGMAYEVIKDAVIDINAAIDHLSEMGYGEFYLIGESTGANKICVYDHYEKNNKVSGYILLGGGDDVGIYYDLYGKDRFWRLLKEAEKMVDSGKGEEIIVSLLPSLFSYQGFYDIANPDGNYNVFPFYEVLNGVTLSKERPLFKMYKNLKKPTLTVYGGEDEYCWGQVANIVDILREQNSEPKYHIIDGADHVFSEHRVELAELIAKWIKEIEQ
jgi:pimeloyl-ACP methyl ester carboxylesterase